MRRWLVPLSLLSAAACAHYPFVVPPAFVPPPKRVAILNYSTGLVGGGQFGIPVPVQDITTPYGAFRDALARSGNFVVADQQFVGTNPTYLMQPTERVVGSLPPLVRPVLLNPAAAPALAQALGADVLLVVRYQLAVYTAGGFGPLASDFVRVWTNLWAYAPNGGLVWEDHFSTDSPSMMGVMGVHDPSQLQHAASNTLAMAGQNAVGRLTLALGGR